jgi:hypothetical protein
MRNAVILGRNNMSPRKRELLADLSEAPSVDIPRPRTRADCKDGPRPCPWAGCRHHLYLDVTRYGGIRLNFPDVPVERMSRSCSLDELDRPYPRTLDEIGKLINTTRERVRQIADDGLRKVAGRGKV